MEPPGPVSRRDAWGDDVALTGRPPAATTTPVGIVTGDSKPDMFMFVVNPENAPSLYDYVYVEVEETPPGEDERCRVRVVAQIRRIVSGAVGLPADTPWPVLARLTLPRGADRIIAVAKVLGYKWRGSILYPRRAPRVGSPVYLAPDDMLEEFYSVEPERRLWIGYLVSRSSVRVYIDVEGLKRHLAILAATGAGKTWTSIVLIEELIKKGATILVLDPHGEYVAIKDSIHKLGPAYRGRVIVLKGRRDQEGDELYSVSVLDIPAEELASIAGVPSKATRIRAVISGAKEIATLLHSLQGGDWGGLRGIMRVIQAAIAAAENIKILKGLARTKTVGGSSKGIDIVQRFGKQLIQELSGQQGGRDDDSWKKVFEALKVSEKFSRGIRRLWLALRKDVEPGYDAIRYLEDLDRLGVYGVQGLPLNRVLRPGTVTVFNLSGLRGEVQDHLAYNILTRVFNARVRYMRGLQGETYRYPVVVIVEEAHRFMPPKSIRQTRTREIAAAIAAEGRKFGVYLVVISQRPSKVDPDVLSQLQSQIILRIVNPRDQDAVRDAGEQLSHDLLSDLPGLNKGEAIIVGPVVPAPLMIRVRNRVLDYMGGDISLVKEWSRSVEEEELVRDYLAELADKLSRILEENVTPVTVGQALARLAGFPEPPSERLVEEALHLLVRDEHAWASYDSYMERVEGEVAGAEAQVYLGEGSTSCSRCRWRRKGPCPHSLAVLIRAVLDDVVGAPAREEREEPWSYYMR